MAAAKYPHAQAVDDDLAGKTPAEVEEERRIMTERAERVRRRLTMNQAFLPAPGEKATEQTKKSHVP